MSKLLNHLRGGLLSPHGKNKSPIKNISVGSFHKTGYLTPHIRKPDGRKLCRKRLFPTSPMKELSSSTITDVVFGSKICNNSIRSIPTINVYSPEKDTEQNDDAQSNKIQDNQRCIKKRLSKLLLNTPDKVRLSNFGINVIQPQILGRGTFGIVIPAVYKGNKVASKIISVQRLQSNNFVRDENAIGLCHKNIIRTLKICTAADCNFVSVIMENCSAYDNLQHLIDDTNFYMDDLKKIKFTSQICYGLNYCHQNKILHLDIKPTNILVSAIGDIKLCDFGASIKMTRPEQFENYQNGTVKYMAPEILRGSKPTEKCDIYSLGITMWQLHYRKVPYEDMDEAYIIYNVVKYNLRPVHHSVKTNNYVQIFISCWSSDPEKRPSLESIMESLHRIDDRNIRVRRTQFNIKDS